MSLESISPFNRGPQSIFLKLFQIAKLLHLFQLIPFLKKLFNTFVLALPSVINVMMLFFIFIYFFAIVGVYLFATTKLQEFLDPHANFQNFWTAFLQVFRMSSCDAWNDVMHDLMRQRTQYFECVDFATHDELHANGNTPNGCGNIFGVIFCITVMIVVTYIFLNLFVAIVIGSVIEISQLSETVLNDEEIEKIQDSWKKFDKDATGFIDVLDLPKYLSVLDEPLGYSKKKMENRYYSCITLWMMELKIYSHPNKEGGFVEFYDVLESLVKKSIYHASTVDKIYHNRSKEDLITGLQGMWDEKCQLMADLQPKIADIEEIKYYYNEKKKHGTQGGFVESKMKLPTLVVCILRISRKLQKSAKVRRMNSQGTIKTIKKESFKKRDSNSEVPNLIEKKYSKSKLIPTNGQRNESGSDAQHSEPRCEPNDKPQGTDLKLMEEIKEKYEEVKKKSRIVPMERRPAEKVCFRAKSIFCAKFTSAGE